MHNTLGAQLQQLVQQVARFLLCLLILLRTVYNEPCRVAQTRIKQERLGKNFMRLMSL